MSASTADDRPPDFQAQFRGVGYPDVVAMVNAAKRLLPAVIIQEAGEWRLVLLTLPVRHADRMSYMAGPSPTDLLERARRHVGDVVLVESDHPAYRRERLRGVQ